jgi:hypothetical protein
MPVGSYREKMMALRLRPDREFENMTPNVLVPSRSVEDGILMEDDAAFLTQRAEKLGYLTVFKYQVSVCLVCDAWTVISVSIEVQ